MVIPEGLCPRGVPGEVEAGRGFGVQDRLGCMARLGYRRVWGAEKGELQVLAGLWAQLECRARLGCRAQVGCWAGCCLGEAGLCVAPHAHWVHRAQLWGSQADGERGLTPGDLHAWWHHVPPTLQPPLGVPVRQGAPWDQVEGAATTWSCGPARACHSCGPAPSSFQPKSILPSSLHPGLACITRGLQSPSLS